MDAATKDRFLDAVASRASLPPAVTPAAAVEATMCVLVERLTPGEAHDLVMGVPAPIRPFFERCARHRVGKPVARFSRAELVDRVAATLGVTPLHAESICRCVFGAIRSQLPENTSAHVADQLPADLKELWFEPPHEPVPVTASATELRAALVAEVAELADLPPGGDAEEAFSIVMDVLCGRLSKGALDNLLLALPETLRPLLFPSVRNRGEEAEAYDAHEFRLRVAERLGTEPDRAERIARAVFTAVERVIPVHEVRNVSAQLPVGLRSLWQQD